MKFCDQCESKMTKIPNPNGQIIFKCRCSNEVIGDDYDTLMFEEQISSEGTNFKHDVFVENSPYDPAALVVKQDCVCGLDFLNMIRIGHQESVMYTCTCGYRS